MTVLQDQEQQSSGLPMSSEGCHTILVVDDEPSVVRSLQHVLRRDFKILGAGSAAEALQMLGHQPVQVIMSDQRMPQMSGVELLGQVRSEYPDIVRLLATGFDDSRAAIAAINQGAVYRYITKPYEPGELRAILREACQRHDLIVERRRLMEELGRKNDELEKANAELLGANHLKEAFIQVASHELRTPLSIVLGLCALAMRQTDIPQPLRDTVVRIDRAAQRLRHLVSQLVTMLWAQRFEQILNRSSVDLNLLLRDAIDDVRPFIELRHQSLVSDFSSELGMMSLDGDKMRDSLNHLLLNAIKFTPDRGTITVGAQRSADGGLELRISDTGAGILAEDLPHLFEPFFTGLDVSRHASGIMEFGRKGLGLGLSVVKSFVELHRGTITVHSRVGEGSSFTIRLPGHAG